MNLDGAFGMCEMEEAAKVILTRCAEAKTWVTGTVYESMTTELQRLGFIRLIYHNWLQAGYHKAPYYVTQDFIERLKTRKISLEGLPDKAPTYQEITFSQTWI